MKLSEVEKVLLHNQYEILRRVNPTQEEDYEMILNCLYSGYYEDLDDLLPHFEKPLEASVRKEVRDILQMYRALSGSYDEEPAAVFIGFDGNEETQHYSYARFLVEDRGLWRESKSGNYNTHTPVLPEYREMLKVWNRITNQFALSPEEIRDIVQHAPYGSRKDGE